MEEPQKRMRWPWWVWLLVILFPIPFGVARWWVTAIFIAVFVALIWIIMRHLNNNSSQQMK
jgi:hypothetical protein